MRASSQRERLRQGAVLILGAAMITALVLGLPRDRERIARASAPGLVGEKLDGPASPLGRALAQAGVLRAQGAESRCLAPLPPGPESVCGDRLPRGLEALCAWDAEGRRRVTVECRRDGDEVALILQVDGEEHERWRRPLPTGASLLPPLIAILLAIVFRHVLIALGAAIWLGATMATGGDPLRGLLVAATDYVAPSVGGNWMMFAFTVSLMGMVNVLVRSGGVHGLVALFARRARGTRSTQLVTAAMGTLVFFDDYANTVIVGASARPLTDARRISREKLAWLVDSTAAPIAGVAVISTWIGIELQLLGEQLAYVPEAASAYDLFFRIVPYRFYCFITLAFVYLVVLTRRDFGPMLRAERRARLTGALLREGAVPLAAGGLTQATAKPGAPPRVLNALLPIVTVLAAAMGGFLVAGREGMIAAGQPFDLLSFATWRAGFVHGGDYSPQVLALSGAAGSLMAMALATSQRILQPREAVVAWLRGVWAMRLALAILALAVSIRAVTEDLQTAAFLVSLLEDVPSLWLPVLSFLVAAAVAFATGTSWGTMGILLPVVVPLVFHHTAGAALAGPVLLLAIASVLDGAIFGDHCSPISDTTVLSSVATASDHMDHVRTQAPYALVVMLAAGLFGYVLIAWTGASPLLSYALAIASLAALLFLVGRRVD